MSRECTYAIEFHGPFRIASGTAQRGADTAVNQEDPLPASSLKGLMRDAALTHLGLDPAIVNEVFGCTSSPSPWSWTPGEVEFTMKTRTRVRIDPDSGVVETGGLIVGEELWARGEGEFRIIRRLQVGDPAQEERHVMVLHASAAAVHALGSDRQRGFGWVSIRPVPEPTESEWSEILQQLYGGGDQR